MAPMAKEPTYHSGFSRLVRPPNSCEPLFAPGQVVHLLGRGLAHGVGHGRIARGQRLSLVERLGGDLAGVVDPHQARRFEALGGSSAPIRPRRRRGAARAGRAGCIRP